ncbi:hypothetical protein M942_09325 [Enterobacter ludwigii]|uniref:hypothetical protein n=1 Tax=Enterobacter TaxID=547 RepID=UPI0003D8605A|nr:hypothetical protein [Enterobacter ludwigii]AHE72818.1 hypothetical protein M942_09325 [Enterobacter ludwigii]KLP39037.1 hypothetical protein ABR36_11495 [Enterobacter ludwigii]HDR2587497.1 hypothetical protein [Enterobacter ludwigii]HDR2598941.1 hypothetical protein [Enterobacter ludwigii]
MKANKSLLSFFFFCAIPLAYGTPQSDNYKIKVSRGPFANVLHLSNEQNGYTSKWKHIMQQQLASEVNYAGHYRVYVDYGDNLPNECGADAPLCGWVIDKITGMIVSKLPVFISNENDMSHPSLAQGCAVYSPEDENDPPPPGAMADFPFFYRDSTLLWMNGTSLRAPNPNNDKCEYKIYNFKNNEFKVIGDGDPSDDPHFKNNGVNMD